MCDSRIVTYNVVLVLSLNEFSDLTEHPSVYMLNPIPACTHVSSLLDGSDTDGVALGINNGLLEELIQGSHVVHKEIGNDLKQGKENVGADFTVRGRGAAAGLAEERDQAGPLILGDVDVGYRRHDACHRVTHQFPTSYMSYKPLVSLLWHILLLVQGDLQQLVANGFLSRGIDVGPPFADPLAQLDCGELSDLGQRRAANDLNEGRHTVGRTIVLRVKRRRDLPSHLLSA